MNSQVKFTTQVNGCTMFFTDTGTTFLLSRETEESVAKRMAKRSVVSQIDQITDNEHDIKMEYFAFKKNFVNAYPKPEIVGENRLPWNNNYFIGNDPSKWRTDVPNYSKIRLKDIYEGIDLVYYGNKNRMKFDFVVQSGADPSQILLKYDLGNDMYGYSLSVNENGELLVNTPLGEFIERKPYCYQMINDKVVEREVEYLITDKKIIALHSKLSTTILTIPLQLILKLYILHLLEEVVLIHVKIWL